MKALKLFSFLAASLFFTSASFAQKETQETFPVSGECGMCKSKIEKAAKQAGATFAAWDVDKKEITVKYNSTESNTAKIKQAIATSGYDSPGFTATDEAYDKLHQCCKYERVSGKSESKDCCKDGKCTKKEKGGKDCCKKDGAMKMDCCKDGKCSKEGHDGKDCCKKEGAMKMDCCKNGKCEMHD